MTTVADLILGSCPAAIGGRIRPIVVDAVERHFGRSKPHVGKEICEIVPPFANCNASTSPIFEARVFGVEASLSHSGPAAVGARLQGVMAVDGDDFSMQTSAALSSSCIQISYIDRGLPSAVASTRPFGFPLKTQSDQSAKAVTFDVHEFHDTDCIPQGAICQ